MSALSKEVTAIVLGRRFFIDLWGILGITPMPCEDPLELPRILPEILSRKSIGCVMVEDQWFRQLPLPLKEKLEEMETPLWVSLPTLAIEEESYEQ
nr:hypothetical protein [uncultured Dethiosulfovibrio sp.]